MAFDAGFIAGVAYELNKVLDGSKVEKIYQPERSSVVMLMHTENGNKKLIISANASSPRVNLTEEAYENPNVPPMFCMLLRKHLTGAKLISVTQPDFERVLMLKFEARDEMGFVCDRYLVCEIMGKYSNIIFCDSELKIINAVHTVDFSTSQKRQILQGMKYELPPPQDKYDPLTETKEHFINELSACGEAALDSYIMKKYKGISLPVSREIAYLANGSGTAVKQNSPELVWEKFSEVIRRIKECDFEPVIIKDADGKPAEYCFFSISQYGNGYICEKKNSFGELIEEYFGKKAFDERIRQRSADISRLVKNAEARLLKKIELQEEELSECSKKDDYKLYGDVITSSIYMLKRGMKNALLPNYYSEDGKDIFVELDERLTPAQNAQKYYKKYNKAKNAEAQLANQLKIAREELEYIYSVADSLERAENENDLNDIRRELGQSGYVKKMGTFRPQKMPPSKPMEFKTENGYRVLCGKNNTQNDYITTKVAEKKDFWFHAKNIHGSHVIMFCDMDEDPPEADFTEAAMIAAYYSQSRGAGNIAVDYTRVKNVKKPAGSKPGFVIYLSNWTAYVTPDEEQIKKMRIK